MSEKTFIPEGEIPAQSQVGASLDTLAGTIAARREAGEESYTFRLLNGKLDTPLKKLMEEAGEVALAAKDVDALISVVGDSEFGDAAVEAARDAAVDHLRYEAADVVYHLLVVLERFNIPLDEFAAELNTRMKEEEIPAGSGMVRMKPEHVKRGK